MNRLASAVLPAVWSLTTAIPRRSWPLAPAAGNMR